MTRYVYDNLTFRLLCQRSEKYAKTQTENIITYTPQSGTNRQDDKFDFDLVGNILNLFHRVTDCGISGSLLGSDALNRAFEYDPLYRVISADGRESDTQHENDYLYTDAPAPGTPNANNVRAYTRNYSFDKLGNVQQVKQLGTNGFTRNFTYNAGHNTLQKVETPTPTLIENFTYDVCGNQLTAGTTRHYVWNAANQLITYYNQAGSADPTIFAQYDYSGMNRVSKLVKTGTTYERTIYIDGIFEYHILENGTTYEKNYIHVMDDQSRIAMVREGTVFPDDIANAIFYNLEDQVSSSVARLDVNGSIIDKEEYYPYGDSSLRTFTKKRYRFSGKEKDAESGLYYYGARYYVAWTCRFISCDPLSVKYPEMSSYCAFNNNPIIFTDPLGLEGEPATEYNKGHEVSGHDGGNDLTLGIETPIGNAENASSEEIIASNGCGLNIWSIGRITTATNLMINIRRPDNGDYYEYSQDPYEDGSFLVVFAESLVEAYSFVKAVSEDNKKYESVVLNIHGSTAPEVNYLGENVFLAKNSSIHFDQELLISYLDIEQYISGSPDLPSDDKKEIQGIVDFMKITTKNFVFLSCGASKSYNLTLGIQKLISITNNELTVYMNGDLTTIYSPKGRVFLYGPLTTNQELKNKFSNGWTRITKDNIMKLKLIDGNTGNLKINKDENPAIYEGKTR